MVFTGKTAGNHWLWKQNELARVDNQFFPTHDLYVHSFFTLLWLDKASGRGAETYDFVDLKLSESKLPQKNLNPESAKTIPRDWKFVQL